MVEHVEEFGAKLEFGALRNREVLKQREIPNLIARSLNAVAADITEGASWWIREGERRSQSCRIPVGAAGSSGSHHRSVLPDRRWKRCRVRAPTYKTQGT